jgi:hypothetical protein
VIGAAVMVGRIVTGQAPAILQSIEAQPKQKAPDDAGALARQFVRCHGRNPSRASTLGMPDGRAPKNNPPTHIEGSEDSDRRKVGDRL